MNLRHIYIPPPWPLEQGPILLSKQQTNHLINVLKFKASDEIMVSNGQGEKTVATLIKTTNNRWGLLFSQTLILPKHSKLRINLLLAVLKSNAMDQAVRQATEIGVTSIHPYISSFSAVSLKLAKKRSPRWEKIAISALEQCERFFLPEIKPICSLNTILSEIDTETKSLFFHERLGKPLPPVINENAVNLIIGPEGGFSDDETRMIINAGFSIHSLSNNILRSETAVVAALAAISTRMQTPRLDS